MAKFEHQPGGLIVGDFPAAIRHIQLVEGEYARGAPIATANGTAHDHWDKTDDAGLEIPVAIVAEDITVPGGGATAPAFFTGEFAADRLVLPDAHTAAELEAALRNGGRSIFIRTRV